MSVTEPKPIAGQPIDAFFEALSSKAPTPGGGAAAALTGATAAATAGMVVSYSLGKKSLAECEEINQNAMARLTRARRMFLQLGDEDAQGYGALNALWTLDKEDPRRREGWDRAVAGAIAPPRAMLALSVELLRLCEKLVETTNSHLRSDLAVAAVLAQGAGRSAAWSVRVNIPLLPEGDQGQMHEAIAVMLGDAGRICAHIESGCA